jgi:predicted glycoside hydrolase/deacetylase ChbG (UPF0249 family)
MKRLIVNADDFGMSQRVNEGIGYTHEFGILTSTTVMMNKPFANELPIYQKKFPNLGFGIHLVLTSGKPIGSSYKTLTTEDGFFKRSFIRDDESYDIEEVYQEWKLQIEYFIRIGGMPTHMDSHHGVHQKKVLHPVIKRLQEEYKLAFRNTFAYPDHGIRTVNRFVGSFYNKTVSAEKIKEVIDSIQEDEIVELMCHTGFVDRATIDASIYNFKRIEELQILTSDEIKAYIKEHNIELISYKGL